MSAPLKVGILGSGMIATADFGVLPGLRHASDRVAVQAIASRNPEHAAQVAEEFGIPRVHRDLESLLADDELDAIVNLTPVGVHAATSKEILRAGKHLVSEKPLASTMADADELIALAEERGRLIVCAPHRMLEPSRILAKRLIQDGAIGPVAFARVRSSHAGPAWRAWPVDPSWYYAADAGPLLDMGVYGVQEITGLLGPAVAVSAAGSRTAPTRTVRGGPFDGKTIEVDVDDNWLLTLHLAGGVFAVVDCTFNMRAARSPDVEIFGHLGTIDITAPWDATATVDAYRVERDGVSGSWHSVGGDDLAERQRAVDMLGRGILVTHLADCLANGTDVVLSAAHARHTLEVLLAAEQSARTGRVVEVHSTF